jgi:hypothetical protein
MKLCVSDRSAHAFQNARASAILIGVHVKSRQIHGHGWSTTLARLLSSELIEPT